MLTRLTVFTQVISALLIAFFVFGFMSASDEILPVGAIENVIVGGEVNNIDMLNANAAIASISQEHGANIARLDPDLESPGSARTLYLAIGDASAASAVWLESGYPDFSPLMTTTVKPWSDLGARDVRGQYIVFAGSGVTESITAELAGMGLQVTSTAVSSEETVRWFLATSGWGVTLVVLALVVVVASGANVILSARRYAIGRLQGGSFMAVLARDADRAGRGLGLVLLVVGLVAAAALYFINGWHQSLLFAVLWTALFAVAMVLGAFVHCLVLMLMWRVPVIAAVKGMIPAKSMLGAIYGVRIVASFLALGVLTATLTLAVQVAGQQESREGWAANSDLSLLQFKSHLSQNEFMTSGELFGQLARQIDGAGGVVLATMKPFESLQNVTPDGKLKAVPGPPVVYVNSKYLERETVVDATGQRISGTDTIQLFIPEAELAQSGTIKDVMRFSLEMWGGYQEAGTLAPGQGVNAFSSINGVQANTSFQDPILVVVPSGSEKIPDLDYLAFASSGGMLFTDPESVMAGLENTEAAGYVTGYRPAASDANTIFQKDAASLRNHLMSAVAVLAVLLATSFGVGLIYTKKSAQRIFITHLHGWSSWRTNTWLIAVEIAAGVSLVGYALSLTIANLSPAGNGPAEGMPPGFTTGPDLSAWTPAMAAVIAALGILFTLLALGQQKNKLIKAHSSEA